MKVLLLLDEHEDEPHFLSKAILRHLQQQEKEEFCVTPPPQQEMVHPFRKPSGAAALNGEWHRSEPMSREPTLMLSLEEPLPLMEPVEDTDQYHGKI